MRHISIPRVLVISFGIIAIAIIVLANVLNSPPVSAASRTQPDRSGAEQGAHTGVYFEENRGQQNGRVKYMTRGGGHTVFLAATEAVYVMMHPTQAAAQRPAGTRRMRPDEPIGEAGPQIATALYMTLEGARADAEFV